MRVLYITYDGVLDPLGRSQVVPLLERLSGLGFRLTVQSFEKRERWRDTAQRTLMTERLRAAGIEWCALRYHKTPSVLATSIDLMHGLALARRIARARGIDLVHARSYPSSLIAWRLHRAMAVPFLFDMRGLYAEERVDGGLWRTGSPTYRAVKRLEREFLRDATSVVTLTDASVPQVRSLMIAAGSRAFLEVIPTPVDLTRFAQREDPTGTFTLAYVGSVGTWYLVNEMLDFGRVLTENVEGARLLLLVNDSSANVRRAASARGIPESRLDVRSVVHEDVPRALDPAWATYAFIRPAPSKVASAATKVSESLALGLPMAVNGGVGDAAAIVAAHDVGVVVDPFAPTTYPAAIARLRSLAADPTIRTRCREAARRHFDLDQAAERYAYLYQRAIN